jgi:hypothetical protein
MSYPINYPTPQGANVQIFNSGNISPRLGQTWIKPQGASFVWFTLIGAGAGGDNASIGGGSGAVTNFMCPAFLIPDELRIALGAKGLVSENGGQTFINYQQKNGNGYSVLTANGGTTGGAGGTAMTANYFTAIGFFQSVAGQAGSVGAQTASATTFLSGGSGTNPTTGNYGYSSDTCGFFQMQPIIVGVGASNGANPNQATGYGCGGGIGSQGGDGMAVIITW